MIHDKRKFIFRKIQESDEQFIIDQFGSVAEFQKSINPDGEFNRFAETLVRVMPLEDFKDFFWKTQADIAALYHSFGPCMGVTPRMQKAANKEVSEKARLKKENRELKLQLMQLPNLPYQPQQR